MITPRSLTEGAGESDGPTACYERLAEAGGCQRWHINLIMIAS